MQYLVYTQNGYGKMTINTIDINEIAKATADTVRVRCAHRGENLAGDDYQDVVNFVTKLLSNYANDEQILNRQYNPKTDTVEVVGETEG